MRYSRWQTETRCNKCNNIVDEFNVYFKNDCCHYCGESATYPKSICYTKQFRYVYDFPQWQFWKKPKKEYR